MTSDASLPPNAPTTPTPTMTTSGGPNATTNGSLTPQPQEPQSLQSNSLARPPPTSDPSKVAAVGDVGGEADASAAEFLDDEHDGTELDVPPNPLPLSEVCRDVNARVSAFLALDPKGDEAVRRTQEHVRYSLDVVARALEEYGFEHLSLSYNGGKDCLVLLLLYLSVLHTHFTNTATTTTTTPPFPASIPSIYATPPDPFPAVTRFVASSSSQYHLSLTHIRTNPPQAPPPSTHPSSQAPPPPPTKPHPHIPTRTFRDAFALYLDTHPSVRAIFVGTRRTDPHGHNLSPFAPTDGNWPRFMRVHPVLDWGLREIWCFLRHPAMGGEGALRDGSGSGRGAPSLTYCAMYDEGYTSLGGRGDTVRNPLLRVVEDDDGGDAAAAAAAKVRYRPAWMMVVDDEERAGRE